MNNKSKAFAVLGLMLSLVLPAANALAQAASSTLPVATSTSSTATTTPVSPASVVAATTTQATIAISSVATTAQRAITQDLSFTGGTGAPSVVKPADTTGDPNFYAGTTNASLAIAATAAAAWMAATTTEYDDIAIGQGAVAASPIQQPNNRFAPIRNIGIGVNALAANYGGDANTAIGYSALLSDTTGNDNVAIGTGALALDTVGYENTAVGLAALTNLTTGYHDTAIGHSAGRFLRADYTTSNQTSTDSTYLGYEASPLADGDMNEIAIGYLATGNGSNSATIGTASTTKTILNGNLGLGTTSPFATLTIDPQASPSASYPILVSGVPTPVYQNSYVSMTNAGANNNVYSAGTVAAMASSTGAASITQGLLVSVYSNPSATTKQGTLVALTGNVTNLSPLGANVVTGLNYIASNAAAGSTVGSALGLRVGALNSAIGATSTSAMGVNAVIANSAPYSSCTTCTALSASLQNAVANTNMTTAYGLQVPNIVNAGTIGTTYGVWIGDITTGTQTNVPWSFYASDPNARNYFAGNTGIGTTTPATALDVNGLIRVYQTSTTTCNAAVEGSIFYNHSNLHFWGCNGTAWNRIDN